MSWSNYSSSKRAALRKRVLERDGYICQWCGADATTVDHVIPVSHGDHRSMTDPENLIAACAHCNYSRGNRATPTRRPQATQSDFWRGPNTYDPTMSFLSPAARVGPSAGAGWLVGPE